MNPIWLNGFTLGVAAGVALTVEALSLIQREQQKCQRKAQRERELQHFYQTLAAQAAERERNGQVRERLRQQGMGLDMPPEDYAKQLGATLALMEDKR